MDMPDESLDDVFFPAGRLRTELFCEPAAAALREAIRLARETRWDNLRSPHVFMGLLAVPDGGVRNWGERLHADLPGLLEQFQELFHQEEGNRSRCCCSTGNSFLIMSFGCCAKRTAAPATIIAATSRRWTCSSVC